MTDPDRAELVAMFAAADNDRRLIMRSQEFRNNVAAACIDAIRTMGLDKVPGVLAGVSLDAIRQAVIDTINGMDIHAEVDNAAIAVAVADEAARRLVS